MEAVKAPSARPYPAPSLSASLGGRPGFHEQGTPPGATDTLGLQNHCLPPPTPARDRGLSEHELGGLRGVSSDSRTLALPGLQSHPDKSPTRHAHCCPSETGPSFPTGSRDRAHTHPGLGRPRMRTSYHTPVLVVLCLLWRNHVGPRGRGKGSLIEALFVVRETDILNLSP